MYRPAQSRLARILVMLGALSPAIAEAAPVAKKAAKTKAIGRSKPKTVKKAQGRSAKLQKVKPSAATVKSEAALRTSVPKGAALVSAALLQYADGKSKRHVDKKIAKALNKVPGGKAAAKRIAARIRAQPNSVKKSVFGPHAAVAEGPTSTKKLDTTVVDALAKGYFPGLGPILPSAHTLPPQATSVPNPVQVRVSGVHCQASEDGDGRDELILLTKSLIASTDNPTLAYSNEVGDAHVVYVPVGATVPTSSSLSLPTDEDSLIVSAVAEVDGDAQQTEQELEVAIELARTLALDSGGPNPAQAFAANLAYVEGMLALSTPDSAPSLVARSVTGSDVTSWWSSPPGTTGDVEWKAQVSHAIGKGSYTVLLDAPAELPSRQMVGLVVTRVKSLVVPVGAEDHLEAEAEIRGASAQTQVALGANGTNPSFHVRRDVVAGNVEIELGLEWVGKAPAYDEWLVHPSGLSVPVTKYCADEPKPGKSGYSGKCPAPTKVLDISPGAGDRLKLRYDPETEQLRIGRKVVRKPASGIYTFKGHGAAAAEIKLRLYTGSP